jgi:hypothetical protein
LIGAEHRKHDRIAASRKIGNACSRAAAELRELSGLARIDIKAQHFEARAQ